MTEDRATDKSEIGDGDLAAWSEDYITGRIAGLEYLLGLFFSGIEDVQIDVAMQDVFEALGIKKGDISVGQRLGISASLHRVKRVVETLSVRQQDPPTAPDDD